MSMTPRAGFIELPEWPQPVPESFDGLPALTKHALGEDPLSGSLFVFINRRSQIKVLYFDRSGYCVWSKRLERGRFARRAVDVKHALSLTQLKLMLEGIELQNIRQAKRFSLDKRRGTNGARELHFRA